MKIEIEVKSFGAMRSLRDAVAERIRLLRIQNEKIFEMKNVEASFVVNERICELVSIQGQIEKGLAEQEPARQEESVKKSG